MSKYDYTMNTLNTLVVVNRSRSVAVSKDVFGPEFAGYKCSLTALRNNITRLCQLERSGADATDALLVREYTDNAYAALRSCYRVFSDPAHDFKLKPCAADLEAIKAICCETRKLSKDADGRDFVAKSENRFRKDFEDFVADRITGRLGKTAEEIDAERKAKADARRAERQAAKAAAEKKAA
jgi:hypothetical protein